MRAAVEVSTRSTCLAQPDRRAPARRRTRRVDNAPGASLGGPPHDATASGPTSAVIGPADLRASCHIVCHSPLRLSPYGSVRKRMRKDCPGCSSSKALNCLIRRGQADPHPRNSATTNRTDQTADGVLWTGHLEDVVAKPTGETMLTSLQPTRSPWPRPGSMRTTAAWPDPGPPGHAAWQWARLRSSLAARSDGFGCPGLHVNGRVGPTSYKA